MIVKTAKFSGYCFGVKRAIKIAEQTLELNPGKKIYTLGQIIHNPGVVENLNKRGIYCAHREQDICPGSMVIIRSHGIAPSVIGRLKKKNIEIVDATCPFVKNAQKQTELLMTENYFVVLIGSKNHPEVLGIKEHAVPERIIVAETSEDLNPIIKNYKIGVLVQTTQTLEKLKEIVSSILDYARDVKIINTICNTTRDRQNEALKLSKKVDMMIVVGGRSSANTTHLAEICRSINQKTYHIQDYREIRDEWFKGITSVGISGGASTPLEDILKVKSYLEAK